MLECWVELLLAAAAIRSPWRRRYLKATPLRGRRGLPEGEVQVTLQAIDRAAGRHLKRMTCLERAAAGQRVLRRRGVPAELRLGVRPSGPEGLEAHAWIDIDGRSSDAWASRFGPLEVGRRPRLAGIRLVGPSTLPLPDDGTETDGECAIHVGPAPEGVGAAWQALPPAPGGGQAWVQRDGRSLVLEAAGDREEALAALLRWALPFASGLQGRMILHASAVSRGDQAWAFVGESGAGKSTLACLLSRRGWVSVADDLLPCRLATAPNAAVDGGVQPVVVLSRQGRLRLRSLFFIERTESSRQARVERLRPAETLGFLLRHGFGELGSEHLWRAQFEFYGTLAEREACRLLIPDDRARLEEAVAFLEKRMLA